MVIIQSRLEAVIEEFGRGREALLPCLKVAQERFGCIPRDVIQYLSEQLGAAPLDIYGAISFYGMLSTKDQGKYVVRVCGSLPCHLNSSTKLARAVAEELAVKPGETTDDGVFTLDVVGCLGLCDKAPAMLINEEIHGPLSPTEARAILMELREKETQ